jgi:hypothetical protein
LPKTPSCSRDTESLPSGGQPEDPGTAQANLARRLAAHPDASTLNADDGAFTSNMAIVATTNGTIDAFSTDSTPLIVDLLSYFAS